MSVWLTALKLVPWDDVIKQTPKLVRQAKGLFRKEQSKAAAGQELAPEALDGRDPQAVAAAVRALHLRVATLEQEQRDTAALMASLAEQQEIVVQALSALRGRARLLTAACGVLALAVVGLLTWISRH